MTCPMCKRETAAQWRPFCSKRCADLDLGKWLTGSYAIPTEDGPDSTDDGQETPPEQSRDWPH